MAFIDSTVVNVALPVLQQTFRASVVDVQWVVESYGLFLGALILAGGAMGDIFGRRKMFLTGVVIFALASAWCGFAQSVHQLIIARGMQGVGAALLTPESLAIISASFDQQSRGKAIGTWSGFTSITMAIGPVLGGWLIQHASWRWAFFINLPIAAAVIVLSVWRVPESRSPGSRRVDWLGACLATIGLGGLVFGLIESSSLGWRADAVVISLAIGAIALVAFVIAEARVSAPMMPLSLFRSRVFAGANLLTLFLYAALGIFFFVFPLNLIQVQKYSPTEAGAAALPLILSMFLLSRWSGGLIDKYGPRRPLVIGPLIVAAGFLLFMHPAIAVSYWRAFFVPFLVLGFGMAVTVAPLTTVVMKSVGSDRAGAASGINNAVARVAGLLSIAVFGILLVNSFAQRLDQELAPISIPETKKSELLANRVRLAALDVPSQIPPRQADEVRRSVNDSFVFAFRRITFFCAVLAFASSLCAAIAIVPATATRPKTSQREFAVP
jgi:EmrB/QacA subfamily drug resistance transporter